MIDRERAFAWQAELAARRRPRDDKLVLVWRGPPRMELGPCWPVGERQSPVNRLRCTLAPN
jgi:hypothetical protein